MSLEQQAAYAMKVDLNRARGEVIRWIGGSIVAQMALLAALIHLG